MKIALGIDGKDSPDVIGSYVTEGADEFLAGYVPRQWANTYGWEISPNRRYYGAVCQYKEVSRLQEVIEAAHEKNARVAVTLNAHQFCKEQLDLLHTLLQDLESIAPDAYIIADPAIILQCREWGIQTPVHLSIGAGCYNSEAVRFFERLGQVQRVVLPRKMTVGEMADLVSKMTGDEVEFEAMVMGYRCHFNDEFCFTWHSASCTNFCSGFADARTYRLPHYPRYWKNNLNTGVHNASAQLEKDSALDQFIKEHMSQLQKGRRALKPPLSANTSEEGMSTTLAYHRYQNCGLCAIPLLEDAGIDVLKLPNRGEPHHKFSHLRAVKQVLDSDSSSSSHPGRDLINSPGFCDYPASCYYNLNR